MAKTLFLTLDCGCHKTRAVVTRDTTYTVGATLYCSDHHHQTIVTIDEHRTPPRPPHGQNRDRLPPF